MFSRRIDSLAEFVIVMRTWKDIKPSMIKHFIEIDKQFIYDFCDKIGEEPEKYVESYNGKVGVK